MPLPLQRPPPGWTLQSHGLWRGGRAKRHKGLLYLLTWRQTPSLLGRFGTWTTSPLCFSVSDTKSSAGLCSGGAVCVVYTPGGREST